MVGARTLKAFIDDSGEKEYGPATGRYFTYAAAIVDSVHESSVNADLIAIKEKYFGTSTVEIKSNWLRLPRERHRRYIEKYGLSDTKLTEFTEELYFWLSDAPIVLLAAVIDKIQMRERYGNGAWHPSAAAYQFLLQRYELHLSSLCSQDKNHDRSKCNIQGHVTVDNMDGASPAANQWRDLLRSQHVTLKKRGCQLTRLRFDHLATDLRFGDSARFHLLQIADLAAYNVMRQFRNHGEKWDDLKATQLPVYDYLGKILGRFMHDDNGRFAGWGIVKWPADRNRRWSIELK